MAGKKYGIAYTARGGVPPEDPIVVWKMKDGEAETWGDLGFALEACDVDGWRGYVCEHPSGDRPPPGWSSQA